MEKLPEVFIPIVIFIIGLVTVWRKENRKTFFITLLIQVGFLTFFIQPFISYTVYLFGILCLFTGIVAYYYTHDSRKQRLRYVGITLASLLTIYFVHTSMFEPYGLTVSDVEDSYTNYLKLATDVPEEEDRNWLDEWSQVHYELYITFDDFYRYQTHTNRLIGYDFIASSEEMKYVKKLEKNMELQHEQTVDNIFRNFHQATSLLPLVLAMEDGQCHKDETMSVCLKEDLFVIDLQKGVRANHHQVSGPHLLSSYFLITGGETTYYVPYSSLQYSSDSLKWAYEGYSYRINGGYSIRSSTIH
ncbi:hypothetical protein N0O92_06175 [Alkalihalobacillus sp. MEB130]|uniref:hypothetical protein n=1 Tax=Alkalihalobacillus sp. MEB130 TaxID=2976704 RepID=UPI0028DD4EB9|nr:hypothetical protein [Alkalihalobacillus sp. MEB130]MDT8859814.1 hypothetical protein [Alkalihalobacillus sp. MEB130]